VPFVFEILRTLRQELEGRQVPLLGFAGAPFTLAAYMVEGRGSKDFSVLKRMMHREPKLLNALLDKLTDCSVGYLNAQIEAGAQAVQLFDTWAGLLTAAEYREWILPRHQQIAEQIHRDQAPLILYMNNGAHLLEASVESGVDVLSLDWRVDLAYAAKTYGDKVAFQGNLDPAALAAPGEKIGTMVRDMHRAAAPAKGYIANLGHGCLVDTPVEGVCAFTEAVRSL
jgi:uroporphyrinogen decarboxylase